MSDEEFLCCAMCQGNPWIVKSEKKNERYYPFVYPCPMCNPHGDIPPIDVDRKEIDKFIEERKKIVPKEESQ